MAKDITIYTSNTCASCRTIKQWLTTKGYTYSVINIDEVPEERQNIISLTGRMEVPVTVVSDQEQDKKAVTVGWKPGEIMAALAA
ncbi:MAG TPA: glutaredoxin family protein [Verrucomicrobiae bacterium]|nr:glutaredoxin family protein [Verrucomicrobiae bacterium]